MIDIHTHIIPNIDDGSKSVEETFNLLNEAEIAGFTDIILTPHYIFDIPQALCRLTSINPLQRNMSLY